MELSSEELKAWGESCETKQPQEVLAAAIERYAPKIVLACSFGAEDVVLLDMVHRINPSVPLFYLDTEFLFPETYATRDRVIEHYGLRPQQVIHYDRAALEQVSSQLVALSGAEDLPAHGAAVTARFGDRG